MDGVLVIDKPSGPTSHDVVARARKALGIPRIGHTGTLDPLATGVLPLVIGRATRLASLLSAGEKAYEAGVRLGSSTETYDAAARLAAGLPPPPPPDISRAQLEQALEEFRGTYTQAPPPYSAKKIGGVAAYRLARRSQPVQPASVAVTVSSLHLVDIVDGLVHLSVTSSAGFYVRSLAHELGERLGCGAHLESLRRTRAGEFSIEHAVPLGIVEAEGQRAVERLTPISTLLTDLPSVVLDPQGSQRARHGNELRPEDYSGGAPEAWTSNRDVSRIRLLDESGRLLGIAREGPGGVLHPAIMLV